MRACLCLLGRREHSKKQVARKLFFRKCREVTFYHVSIARPTILKTSLMTEENAGANPTKQNYIENWIQRAAKVGSKTLNPCKCQEKRKINRVRNCDGRFFIGQDFCSRDILANAFRPCRSYGQRLPVLAIYRGHLNGIKCIVWPRQYSNNMGQERRIQL